MSNDNEIRRFHFLFTGKRGTRPYAMKLTPAGASDYEVELTTAYPTDGTISGQWLRRYPADFGGDWEVAPQRIRRDMLRYCHD